MDERIASGDDALELGGCSQCGGAVDVEELDDTYDHPDGHPFATCRQCGYVEPIY